VLMSPRSLAQTSMQYVLPGATATSEAGGEDAVSAAEGDARAASRKRTSALDPPRPPPPPSAQGENRIEGLSMLFSHAVANQLRSPGPTKSSQSKSCASWREGRPGARIRQRGSGRRRPRSRCRQCRSSCSARRSGEAWSRTGCDWVHRSSLVGRDPVFAWPRRSSRYRLDAARISTHPVRTHSGAMPPPLGRAEPPNSSTQQAPCRTPLGNWVKMEPWKSALADVEPQKAMSA